MIRRFFAFTAIVALAVVLSLTYFRSTVAQYGGSLPIGFVAGATNLSALTTTVGAAGTVTNPGSNLVVQVDGGPVYCNGAEDSILESNVTLPASSTVLIVYNCAQNFVYAKKGVTAPGTPSPDQPGVPATLLFATPFVEVPLATVVCTATVCGTITDQRPLANFPVARMMPQSTFANLPATYPNGAIVYCSNCLLASSPCSGASTGALALRVNGAWRCQ